MNTLTIKNLRGLAAAVVLLAVVTGCGTTVTPINSGSKSTAGGGTWDWGNGNGNGSGGGDDSGGDLPVQPTPSPSAIVDSGPAVQVSTPWSSALIASGDTHTCEIDHGGAVWCWGLNSAGELGNGNTTTQTVPVRTSVLTSNTKMIAAGGDHTCALDGNGAAWCWGGNAYGQLGINTVIHSTVPVRVASPLPASGIRALAVGLEHVCAIDASGTLWCWGHNNYGQLGNGSTNDSHVPVAVAHFTGGAVAIALGGHHSCATDSLGSLFCWGWNNWGRLGDGTETDRYIPTQVSGMTSGIVAVSLGYTHSCAVDQANKLWCWGSNYYGQFGNGSTNTVSGIDTPTAIAPLGISITTLALGAYHTCATDGGQYVSCWGYDKSGQVGNSTMTTSTPSPHFVDSISPSIRGLASGGYQSCVLDAVGTQCWGDNSSAQLGIGSYTNTSYAVHVSNTLPPSP